MIYFEINIQDIHLTHGTYSDKVDLCKINSNIKTAISQITAYCGLFVSIYKILLIIK